MTEQEYFEHFVQRAKERYGIIVDAVLYRTINIAIQKQFQGTTLIDHRRDGELWHLAKGPFAKSEMFIVFDKGLAVTCLPPTNHLRRQFVSVKMRAQRGKPIPKRIVVEEDDMHFRHCYHSMLDYYGYTLTKEEWLRWNQRIANGEVMFIQSNDGVRSGRLLDKGRSLVVAYKWNKVVDVRPPSRYWQERVRRESAKKSDLGSILARKIREQNVIF